MLLIPKAQQSKAAAPQYIKRTQSQYELEKAVSLTAAIPTRLRDARNVFNDTSIHCDEHAAITFLSCVCQINNKT